MFATDPSVASEARLPPPDSNDVPQFARQNRSDVEVPRGGLPRALRELAELNGMDPIAQLYNEALQYANGRAPTVGPRTFADVALHGAR